jgi:hypothetical protein
MPKIEYGIDEVKIAELKTEIEQLKMERINAFIEGNQSSVEFYTSRMMEVTTELETMNGNLEN